MFTRSNPAGLHLSGARRNMAIALPIAAITALGIALRVFQLDWQPLWWDEGYSVYFATEPLARMVWLTAHDIHPPLYFALAHLWTTLLDSTTPATFRLLSIVAAVPAIPLSAWLAYRLSHRSLAPPLLIALLLAVHPMHIFYSQEVRMYGLGLTLSLAATCALVLRTQRRTTGKDSRLATLIYVLCATASIYTLYYAGLVLIAHVLWLLWRSRKAPSAPDSPTNLLGELLPFLWVGLLYLPWVLYAVPRLIPYIQGKIVADEDSPLNPLSYGGLHWVAFTGGHLTGPENWLSWLRLTGLAAPLLLLLAWWSLRRKVIVQPRHDNAPFVSLSGLWFFLLIPFVLGFIINLVFPFFPQGGERLLFLTLPYFLLLVILLGRQLANGLSSVARRNTFQGLVLGSMFISAIAGTVIFFTTPRYVNEDYRPLIRAVMTGGRDQDRVLAIFPWQIGYWRAYSPRLNHEWLAPQPALLDQEVLEWGDELRAQIDRGLESGTLWFPAPLGFGSTLPHEIEDYLIATAVNVADQWHSPTTRLSAWSARPPDESEAQTAGVELSPESEIATGTPGLVRVRYPTPAIAAANEPLIVTLDWQFPDATSEPGFIRVELRLINDQDRRIWASRSYEPAGRFIPSQSTNAPIQGQDIADNLNREQVGLLVPYGLPPGSYTLEIAVSSSTLGQGEIFTESEFSASTIRPADEADNHFDVAVIQAHVPVEIVPPSTPGNPSRLPIVPPFPPGPNIRSPYFADEATSIAGGGLRILGIGGMDPTAPMLAGTPMVALLQLQILENLDHTASVAVELRAPDDTSIIQHEFSPTEEPGFPASWLPGALHSMPFSLFIPGYVGQGDGYTLQALLSHGETVQSMPLATLSIVRREQSFSPPVDIAGEFDLPYQLGTHAELLGYDSRWTQDSTELHLYWHVLAPIVPPHHVFIHITDLAGQPIAQVDTIPATATGNAPTGSWSEGEYLATVHRLPNNLSTQPVLLRIGLYEPQSQVRLPVSIAGEIIGDGVEISLP